MRKKKKVTPKRNPVAKALASAHLKPKKVGSKKVYNRKRKYDNRHINGGPNII